MKNIKVAIIEDEPELLEVTRTLLESRNYLTYGFSSYEEFMPAFKKSTFNIILTDKNLTGKDGLDLASHVRKVDKKVPIFIITGMASTKTTIDAFNIGVDDYIDKPVDLDILDVKIRRAVAKVNIKPESKISFNDDTFEVHKKTKSAKLTPHEFSIMKQLFLKQGKLVNRDEISTGSSETSLDVHIFSLRKKLNPLRIEIITVKGKGYTLKK